MRFDGKLDKWNDDRGFGFITPLHGGEPVFVHISAFARDGRRPRIGEQLTFEVEPAGDGKKRAVNVRRPGARSGSTSREAVEHRRRAGRRTGGRGVSLAIAAVVIAAGVAAFTRSQDIEHRNPPAAGSAREFSAPPAAPNAQFRCDGRTMCSQMTSCEEATFFLANCPDTKMDGDHDGIPCERQWCF